MEAPLSKMGHSREVDFPQLYIALHYAILGVSSFSLWN